MRSSGSLESGAEAKICCLPKSACSSVHAEKDQLHVRVAVALTLLPLPEGTVAVTVIGDAAAFMQVAVP